MDILILNWRDIKHPEAGGAEVYVHELAKRWIQWGHSVHLFTARPKGQGFRDNVDGVEVFRAGGRYSVYLYAVFVYLMFLRHRTEVILDVENGIPFFTPLYSLKPKVILMLHVHQDQFLVEMGPVLGRLGRFMEKRLIPVLYRGTKYTAISRSTVNRMRESFTWARHIDVGVAHPGIDHQMYIPAKEKYPQPTILYLGRIKAYKRVPLLVEMMPEILANVNDARLLIAGKGDALDQVKEAAARLGLEASVHFLGYVSEEQKMELLQQSWVTATPSMNEGWGMTVVEANACGTPAVAYRVSGLDESVRHDKSGLLADSDRAFADSLISLLKKRGERERLSRGAIDWASEYDWEKTAKYMLGELLEQADRG